MAKRNTFARKSSIEGRQQRADARVIAFNEARRLTVKSVPGFHMPDPGPKTAGKRKGNRFVGIMEARDALARANGGLRAFAANDYLSKHGQK